jgi:hypothetical protein
VSEAKQFLFDLDKVFFRQALTILSGDEPSFLLNDGSGPRYFVMSNLFENVVEQLIRG